MSNSVFGWYYPAGAENDPRAPYNQVERPDLDFEFQLTHTFHIEPTIESNDYGGYEGEECYEGNEIEDFKTQYISIQSVMEYCIELLLDRVDTLKSQGMQMREEYNGKGAYRWIDMKLCRECDRIREMIKTLELYVDVDTDIEKD